MNEDLTNLDFSFDNLPPELLNNPESDIFRGFGENDLDLDSLLNSNLIEENGCELVTGQVLDSSAIIDRKSQANPNVINNSHLVIGGVDVKADPDIAPNQSPVLESLLKSSVVRSQCVNPAPQTNTTFAPTITTRSQPITTTTVSETLPSPDNEALLAALLKRHEEDRKILDHLVTDIQRKSNRETVTAPAAVPKTLKNPSIVQLPSRTVVPVEQPNSLPAQVVVATPVNARPVGIISGTRMIVTKPAATIRPPAAEMPEEMDIGDDDNFDDEEPRRPKTKRRSSHNAIEKRYRLSINMRIDEMRTLIDGADSKLSKSAVLRRAIERIRSTERENYLLRKELAAAGITPRCTGRTSWADVKKEFASNDDSVSSPESLPISSTSPASSMGGSPPHSPPEHVTNVAGTRAPRLAHLLRKPEPQGTALIATLGSRSRLCLAAIFFGLFLVNPLALWDAGGSTGATSSARLISPGGAMAHGGRTILGYWERETTERRSFVWLAAAAVVALAVTLVWLLRFHRKGGVTKAGAGAAPMAAAPQETGPSEDLDFLVWRHWAQAEAFISEAAWRKSVSELKKVLVALDNPLPIGRLDWVQFVAHHVAAACGLSDVVRASVKPDTADLNCRAMSKLVALAHHGHLPLNAYQKMALIFALGVSMRRSQQLSGNDMCRALINLSLMLPLFRSRVRRFAAEALQTAECEKQTTGPRGTGLAWILTPDGFAFLRQFHVPPGPPVVAPAPSEFGADEAQVDLSEGASVVALALRRHLMAEVMELLASKKDDRLEEVLRLLGLLVEFSVEAELLNTDPVNQLEVNHGIDSVQHWWANMATVAALWRQDRLEASRAHHAIVDVLPRGVKARLKSRDSGGGLTLAQAVQIAYRVQRRALFGRPEVARPCSHNALKMADEAATFLEARTIDREEREKQYWLWSAFACDWLLSARVALNQPPNAVEGLGVGSQRAQFERNLATLQACLGRAGLSGSEAFRRWVVLHQARLRLWCGSHPVRTALSLRRRDDEQEERRGGEVRRVREWLQQRLLRARPTGGLNGIK